MDLKSYAERAGKAHSTLFKKVASWRVLSSCDFHVEIEKASEAWRNLAEIHAAPKSSKEATRQADPTSPEFVDPAGAAVKGKGKRVSNTNALSDSEKKSKPGTLRRLARVANGELSTMPLRGPTSPVRASPRLAMSA